MLVHQVNILHVSDLHVGMGTGDTDATLLSSVRTVVNRLTQSGLIFRAMVVSGDMIHSQSTSSAADGKPIPISSAQRGERYGKARDILTGIAKAAEIDFGNIVLCPGNQDVEREETYPFVEYIRFVNSVHANLPALAESNAGHQLFSCCRLPLGDGLGVALCSMNSNDGSSHKELLAQISQQQIEYAAPLLDREAPVESTMRVLVLHHGIGLRSTGTLTSQDAESVFEVRRRLDLLRGAFYLCGHLHNGTVDPGKPPGLVAGRLFCGEGAAVSKEPHPPQFSIVTLLLLPYVVRTGLAWGESVVRFEWTPKQKNWRVIPVNREEIHVSDVFSGDMGAEAERVEILAVRDRLMNSLGAIGAMYAGWIAQKP